MGNDNKLRVLERKRSFTLGLPNSCVWDFIYQFGDKFPKKDNAGQDVFRPVNSYRRGNPFFGWIVEVTIEENLVNDFSEFLKQFCENNQLTFEGKVFGK